eukprot:275222-Rhodomonas_salina.1
MRALLLAHALAQLREAEGRLAQAHPSAHAGRCFQDVIHDPVQVLRALLDRQHRLPEPRRTVSVRGQRAAEIQNAMKRCSELVRNAL